MHMVNTSTVDIMTVLHNTFMNSCELPKVKEIICNNIVVWELAVFAFFVFLQNILC